jgi:hypothetical protein
MLLRCRRVLGCRLAVLLDGGGLAASTSEPDFRQIDKELLVSVCSLHGNKV